MKRSMKIGLTYQTNKQINKDKKPNNYLSKI